MTLNNNLIREWPSIISAEKAVCAFHITECCKGKRKSSGGYHWIYKSDYKPYIKYKNNNKEVIST